MAAFNLAWDEGADGIEADFRLSGDGRIVCLHDASTGRTAGKDLAVASSSLAELRRLDVGSWLGAAWKEEPIPTLAEVLEALPPEKMLFIELKSGPEIAAPLAHELFHSGVAPEQLRLLSFSAPLLTEVKVLLPGYRTCWLTDYRQERQSGGWRPSREEVLATLRQSGVDGLASRGEKILDAQFVADLRRGGYEIHVWTVDDKAAASCFVQLGVDSIMTNRPGWLRQQLHLASPLAVDGALS
jgi:glycerophosphoryl diester phosphodiesterase